MKSIVTYGDETWKFNKYLESNICRWKLFFSEIGEMLKIRKNINNVIREKMNTKNSVLDYIRYKQLN